MFLCGFVFVAFNGCAGPRPTPPDVDASTLPDDVFQAYLAEVELVTVDEAYRAMLILADGEDGSVSFEERKSKLESREIARSAWKLRPEDVVDAGSVAYMVCRICDIDGGLNMRLLGRPGLGDRRYALRELIYREMINESVDYQYMTGPAFLAVIRKADELMAEKGMYDTGGVDLSDETDRDAEGNLVVPPPRDESPTTQPGE
ncbi:MAG TPA: hypothetical protein VNT79_07535 [Phycisphaerae bacterium]|nr:hypothetical protein [Phycisphaerae bacterium]